MWPDDPELHQKCIEFERFFTVQCKMSIMVGFLISFLNYCLSMLTIDTIARYGFASLTK